MAFRLFKAKEKPKEEAANGVLNRYAKGEDLFKAYIPNFLYRPPYGMPRRDNPPLYKNLAKNPFVFSVIKTIIDAATSVDWEIKVKKEYQDEGVDYTEKIKEITKFFRNPNGNEQSFEHLQRQVITDLLECDSGLLVKVFNVAGEFKQLFARDGSLFLKNPDIYGYMGDKRDFVQPLPDGFTGVGIDVGGATTESQQKIMHQYSLLYRDNAAYFQYGWTAGSMPVPFGKREIVYIMQNPRGDSIYGRSPLQILTDVIFNLIYGVEFNLDFYVNNNIPDGVIQLLGANQDHIQQFRDNMDNQVRFTDELGNKRKIFNKMPISSTEVKFTPFQLTAKDMEVMAQQKWFTKLLWMCFGVNADDMGFTEDSNRATGEGQIRTAKRKAINPILSVLAYHYNTQIMPEFFMKELGEFSFCETPLEFVFDDYDIEEDVKLHNLLQQKINMGVMTPEMAAVELGIDVVELTKQKEESLKKEQELNGDTETPVAEDVPKEEKSKEKVPEEKAIVMKRKQGEDNVVGEIESYIDTIGDQLVDSVEQIKNESPYFELKGVLDIVIDKFQDIMTLKPFQAKIDATLDKEYTKGMSAADEELKPSINLVPDKKNMDFLNKYVMKNLQKHGDAIGDNLRQELQRGLMNNESVDELKKRVISVFKDKTYTDRMKTVLRTEKMRANNAGSFDGALQAQEAGVKIKKYLDVIMDSRTSDVCIKENGKYGTATQAIPLSKKFKVTVKNQTYEELHPPFLPNCRTTLRYVTQ